MVYNRNDSPERGLPFLGESFLLCTPQGCHIYFIIPNKIHHLYLLYLYNVSCVCTTHFQRTSKHKWVIDIDMSSVAVVFSVSWHSSGGSPHGQAHRLRELENRCDQLQRDLDKVDRLTSLSKIIQGYF